MSKTAESNRGVLAQFKAETTPNVSEGIELAARQVLTISGVSPASVSCVSIGTTAFVNAVLEADGRRLAKVAVIRLCGPYTRQCPPFIDFPERLRALTEGYIGFVDGGLESMCHSQSPLLGPWDQLFSAVDGREIAPINETQIITECLNIKDKGIKNVSISSLSDR